ncbi:hypothetical protein J8Z24_03100 [Pseudoalteromonas sp. SCSIO 43201]|uniref:hypothetical protein n=1 Tax=Pseudoalteromonas sp. SCSIO 43201 TaxID=2822842 RepID=UPI0020754A75|nr:hypothetical protein [Pseudoalteromonas sp. SCSIO 43201]USD29097.1 hypothetical protein J8Z24_03100 [Pseudoalteromonas sp. SCSIO 43201]
MISNKKSLLALSVASALTLSGCFSDDDDNNVVVVPPTEPTDPVVVAPELPDALALVVSANVVDAATQRVVDANVRFLENGVASQNIVDVDGNAISMIEGTGGSFAFTKKEDATLTEVTVSVTADGYIGKSFVVNLTAEEGQTVLPVQLAITSKNAEGVSDTVVPATIGDDGSSSEAIVAQTSGKAAAGANIPAGVILRDASGNLVTGQVSVNVSGADASSSAVTAILPEGLNAGGAANVEQAVGVANVLVNSATGSKVKQFSNPITVTTSIPATTTLNGVPIKTGDALSLKSHNEDTGVWTAESTQATVGSFNAETNTYTGSFQTDHLTFFAITRSTPACTNDMVVNFTGAAVPSAGLLVTETSSDASASGYAPGGSSSLRILSGALATRYGVSAEATARVRVFDFSNNIWFDSVSEVPVCGTVQAELVEPVTYVAETFSLTATCSNDATVSVPLTASVVRYSLPGFSAKTAVNLGAGSYQFSDMVEGSTYNVSINPRVNDTNGPVAAQTTTITAGGAAESLNITISCSEVTGA